MDALDKYIIVIKNIIPHQLCDDILNEYKDSNEWQESGVSNGESNKTIRNCDTIQISQPFVIRDNNNRFKIDQELFQVAANCINQYNNLFQHSSIQQDTGYELLRYKEKSFYIQHVDSFLQAPRLVSCSLHLNDDYEGGEFAFFNRTLKYKLNKGDVLMFPSTFMYPHEVMPVTKGTRYSIITWFR